MGIKRVVDTNFWLDDKVIESFSPEDKLFMLYCITNPHTTQLGIYSINKKVMSFELGYTIDVISVLLERFENKYNMIRYSNKTNEIAIKNCLKHSIIKGGYPVRDCLIKEMKNVKDKSLIEWVFSNLKNEDNINDTVKNIIIQYETNNGEFDYSNKKEKDNIYSENENENENDVSYHDTSNDTSNDTSKSNKLSTIASNFEKIWDIYPRKDGKNTAFKHYKAWLKGKQYAGKTIKLTNKQMWFAVSRYADECVESKREKQYIKMGSTFFNEAIMEYVKDDS